ncbi:MAG: inovirus Gp2 family protein [Cycloclasticus sp.]
MNTRLTLNRNEIRYDSPSFRGLHVINHRGPLVMKYLESNFRTVECALAQYPRTFATRFELLFPQKTEGWQTDVISKFTEALKSEIGSYLREKGLRADSCKPRFIWAKERSRSLNPHYHVMLFLNKDVFFRSGNIVSENWNLVRRIESAWARALGVTYQEISGLVHFPKNRDYIVNVRHENFLQQLTDLFYRASYLAKEDTKEYSDGTRHFSCSHFTQPAYPSSLDSLIQYHKRNTCGILEGSYLLTSEFKRGLQQ